MHLTMKKITVVIVTYNGEIWIKKNISSLLHSSYPVSIIVVDNDSTDNTLAILATYKTIQIIKSTTNLGFGKANNLGIKKAFADDADAVFLLNQDTWIYENTISTLIESSLANPEFGILSPMHYSADEVTLDENFEVYYKKKMLTNNPSTVTVPFVNAAAWLVTKECFNKVGLFEPVFNHYGEDRNFCDRVLFHKLKIGIVQNAKICHDRKISRNYRKDVLQSKYKILSLLLDVNHSSSKSFLLGLKNVFGLPKYFLKFYGFKKTFNLQIKLLCYYCKNLLHLNSILTIRKNAAEGNNGK